MVDRMSQRNTHRSTAKTNRLRTATGLLQVRVTLLLALLLVLLIINGGAG